MKRRFALGVLSLSLLILALPLTTVYILPHPLQEFPEQAFQEEVVIPTADGKAKMGCLFLKADSAKANIIFLHGIRGNYGHFYSTALTFREKGYNCLLVNLRANGNSTGSFTTYGYKEKHDVKELANFLNQHNELPSGIWATSLGAAIGLQHLGTYPNELKFGIIESTFTNLYDVIYDYFSRFTGVKNKKVSDWLINTAGKYTGFQANEINPNTSCETITANILFVHGKKDEKMDPTYSQENFNAVNHPRKQLMLLENANHENVLNIGAEAYLALVERFVEESINTTNN